MKVKILFTAIFASLVVVIYSQPEMLFIGNQDNPVLDAYSGGWDDGVVFTPSVLHTDNTFYLFYSGTLDPFSQPVAIGYATSDDGYNFTKVTVNEPIFEADGSGFDAWSVSDGIASFNGSEWTLFYGAKGSQNDVLSKAIGRATATDLNGTWLRPEDPIINLGSPGEWDSFFMFPVSCIKIEDTLYLYYWAGNSFPTGDWQIGLATSPDGLTWTKYDDPATTATPFAESDPVLQPGVSGEWDDNVLAGCSVLKTATGLEMFYSGEAIPSTGAHIGYATSQDGINWVKEPVNPIYQWHFDPYASTNNYTVLELPSVVVVGASYYMYYDYGPHPYGIGLATANALEQTIHVPGDQPTIQNAIEVATDGDTILVADGTYIENINFRGKAIIVASQYIIDNDISHIENTIIDGSDPVNPDIGSVVTFSSGEDNLSELHGFTITGGTGNYIPPGGGFPPIRAGGGISINMAGPKIISNHIVNNTTVIADGMSDGAGISCGPPWNTFDLWLEDNIIENNYSSSGINPGAAGVSVFSPATIIGNTITNNLCESELSQCGPSGLLCAYNEVTVQDNTITHNKAYSHQNTPTQLGGIGAGAGFIYVPSGLIKDNTINNNRVKAAPGDTAFAAGMLVEFCTNDLLLDANTIANNGFDGEFCYGGGLAIWYGGATLHNNMIYGDSATYGAGICMFDTSAVVSEVKILNNTITDNYATVGGKGLFSHRTNATIMNSIFWNPDNPANDEIMQEGGDISIIYSVVNEPYNSGEGNFYEDPEFEDPSDSDFHLTQNSLCVNAGTDIEFPPFDFEGDDRPHLSTLVDIGADESPFFTNILDKNVIRSELLSVYPNPVDLKTTLKYFIPEKGLVNISVIDITGKEVDLLISKNLQAGTHKIEWNTNELESGLYFLRLETNGISEIKKLILLR